MVFRFSWIILLTLSTLLLSCGTGGIKSGHYIQLQVGDSVEVLAKKYQVPKWVLQEVNSGKRFKPGEWVFVPLKRGIWGQDIVAQAIDHNPIQVLNYLEGNNFLWPLPAGRKVSSNFGHRWGRAHEGVDIAARRGSHIVAAASGVVVYSGSQLGGYGNITVIAHHYGLFTVYAHAAKNYTATGQRVTRGEVIATVGSTGKSTGPHLHFEIRREGKAINPLKYLAKR